MAAEHASNSQGRNKADHLKPYRWAPGQSGNPNGRPKGTSLTDCIRVILGQHQDDGRLAVEALAEAGVKAAMAGKTEMIVGKWHGRIVHVPIQQAISQRKTVDTEGDLWLSVLEATGQPAVFE